MNWKAPVTDIHNWPRLVQLGYILYDQQGQHLTTKEYIIRPEGFTIPEAASNVHGITTERAMQDGLPLRSVLDEFHQLIHHAETLVAHNIAFDEKIIGAEFLRNQYHNNIPEKKKVCTMLASVDFCAINGPYGYKWPSLTELHKKLFNKSFDNAHNALADIRATADCFWELRRLQVIG